MLIWMKIWISFQDTLFSLGQYSYYTLGFHAHKNTFGKSAAGTLFSVSSTDFTVTISMTSECFIVLDSSFKETFTTFTCENSIVITYKRKFKMHQHNWYLIILPPNVVFNNLYYTVSAGCSSNILHELFLNKNFIFYLNSSNEASLTH